MEGRNAFRLRLLSSSPVISWFLRQGFSNYLIAIKFLQRTTRGLLLQELIFRWSPSAMEKTRATREIVRLFECLHLHLSISARSALYDAALSGAADAILPAALRNHNTGTIVRLTVQQIWSKESVPRSPSLALAAAVLELVTRTGETLWTWMNTVVKPMGIWIYSSVTKRLWNTSVPYCRREDWIDWYK